MAAESTDLVGANGLDLADRSSQTPVGTPAWPLDGLHGAEADASEELLHFGARHMAMRDGLWLQPEPLLYLGPTNGNLRNPLGFGPLYAMGNTNALQDRSGYCVPQCALAIAVAEFATGLTLEELVGVTVGAFAVQAGAVVSWTVPMSNSTFSDPDEARAMNWAKGMADPEAGDTSAEAVGSSVSSGLDGATAARDAAIDGLSDLPSKERKSVSTVVGVHDPATGNIAVGVKKSGCDSGKCAEDLAAEQLPGNPDRSHSSSRK
ncbi:MAG: hypothetical protein KC621_10090 [Myxococcales bacterium]|nr:hypothetical protein [Myxococcales bacterium]